MHPSDTANTALLAPPIASLFPAGTIAADLTGSASVTALLAEEAVHLGEAVATRREEFAAGRLCARRALEELGVRRFAIKVGGGRQPLWPDAVVGSITHTQGYCAAVVARGSAVAALGVDVESRDRVHERLWPSICTHGEIEWLHSLPCEARLLAAAIVFCAKEAFYKCQYPTTAERLSFHDVRIEVTAGQALLGIADAVQELSISPLRRIAYEEHASFPLRGRAQLQGERAIAAVAIER